MEFLVKDSKHGNWRIEMTELSIGEKLDDLVVKYKSLSIETAKTLAYLQRVQKTGALSKDPTMIRCKYDCTKPLINTLVKSFVNINFETNRSYEAIKSLRWFFGLFKKKQTNPDQIQ